MWSRPAFASRRPRDDLAIGLRVGAGRTTRSVDPRRRGCVSGHRFSARCPFALDGPALGMAAASGGRILKAESPSAAATGDVRLSQNATRQAAANVRVATWILNMRLRLNIAAIFIAVGLGAV